MIRLYDVQGAPVSAELAGNTFPAGAVLIDLISPDAAETGFVERVTGITLPSAERLEEVEVSSRLAMQGDIIQVTSPIVYRSNEVAVNTSPVGFVLSHRLLVTIRFVELQSFTDFLAQKPLPIKDPDHANFEIFLGLLETIVDRMADAMEQVGADLDRMSMRVFEPDSEGKVSSKPNRVEKRLTRTLKTIGRNGNLTSHARNSLLGLGRLVAYVGTHSSARLSGDLRSRLDTLRQDIASLSDYENRLTDKVQFLLDSTLGFINIEQNRTFKILTVASVIGIPPTFVVGLYGMNFKYMPELEWSHGYLYGLTMIVVSIIVPAVWLRWRGWF